MAEEIVEAPAATLVTETPAEKPVASDATLLGGGNTEVKPEVGPDGKPVVKAEVKIETPEEKTAREAAETPEQKAAREKTEADAKAAKVVPEKYDVKAPEGMELDQVLLDKVTPIFKKLNITQEGAQELIDAYAPHIKAQVEADAKAKIDAWKGQVESWKTESVTALGADAAKEMAFAAKFIDKFGTPKLREILNETGVGNHIEVVQAFIKAGKAISPDALAEGTKSTGTVDLYDHPASKATLK